MDRKVTGRTDQGSKEYPGDEAYKKLFAKMLEEDKKKEKKKLKKVNTEKKIGIKESKGLLKADGSSIKKIHGTISKLTGHVRKAVIRIGSLEKRSDEIEGRADKIEEKTSRIVDILKNQKSKIGEKIPGSNKDTLNKTLVETNKILVDILNQLTLQSKEEQKRLEKEKSSESILKSKEKLKKEESLLEKTSKGIGKVAKKIVSKAFEPIGNIFGKILEFITLLGAGIATNAALEWLSKKENREQLDEWFGWVAENWKWVAGAIVGVLALKPLLNIVGAIGGAIRIIRTALDVFGWARKKLFGGGKPAKPSSSKAPAGGKPTLTVGDPGKAGGQRGGFRDPGKYRQPGQTRAGSSFQLEQAQKALRQGGGNLTPKGNIFSKLSKIRIGKTNLALIGLQLTDYFMPKISGGKFEDLSDIVESGTAKVGIGVKTYSDEKLLKEYKTLREDYDKSMAVLIANPVPGIDPMTVIGSFEDYGFGRGRGLVREIERRGLTVEPRAMGGPVIAGNPYIVGERGPELFMSRTDGQILNSEKTYQLLSSDMREGSINMIELPPITNQMPPPEIPLPAQQATDVPEISSTNMADPYRQLSPLLYGITV